MQRKSTYIKATQQIYSTAKLVFNYCLLLLFTFAFSLQQFSAFAYTQLAESSTKENSPVLHAQHLFSSSQLSYHLPFASNLLQYEMEVVEEEDDHERKNSNDDGAGYFLSTYASTQCNHTNFLKSRYLHLASSANKRSAIPLFILHHSWKSYLA
jgi:hypothetical protein